MEYAEDRASARKYDANDWYEIKENPLSKVGVFPYLGASIDASLDPDKVYMVLRPEEELSSKETLDSFRLLPVVDEHVMLGANFTPAEDHGVHGVIGDNVFYRDGTIFGNLKVFSSYLSQKVDGGKRELSAGYRCSYDLQSGTWNGQHYDAVQRNVRGNHVALVNQGRMGRDVAVLDHFKITFDEQELTPMSEAKIENKEIAAVSLDQFSAQLKAVMDSVSVLAAKVDALAADKEDEKKAEDKECDKEDEKEKKSGMDAAEVAALRDRLQALEGRGVKDLMREISARNALVEKLVPHIGTFDHAEMTLADVSKYGVAKLGLKCDEGTESAVLSGFLHQRPAQERTVALDSAGGGEDPVAAYLSGK